jgi:hypothetical protein
MSNLDWSDWFETFSVDAFLSTRGGGATSSGREMNGSMDIRWFGSFVLSNEIVRIGGGKISWGETVCDYPHVLHYRDQVEKY